MARYAYKSEDMLLTSVRSRDNGVLRVAIAFHARESIGGLEKLSDQPTRWVYRTTAEFDDWASTFLGLPGLRPERWSRDPQHDGIEQISHHPQDRMDFMRERGPKRDLLLLDTEEQAMLFKMRWQDAP